MKSMLLMFSALAIGLCNAHQYMIGVKQEASDSDVDQLMDELKGFGKPQLTRIGKFRAILKIELSEEEAIKLEDNPIINYVERDQAVKTAGDEAENL